MHVVKGQAQSSSVDFVDLDLVKAVCFLGYIDGNKRCYVGSAMVV